MPPLSPALEGAWLQMTGACPSAANFVYLLMSFANSLDPDQAQENARPDLDPSCLTPR